MEGSVTVQEVMDRGFVGVSESDSVADSAELMLSEGCESVVVLRGSEPVGVVDQRDALAAFVSDESDTPVAEVMSREVPTVRPETTVEEAAERMTARAAQQLVVTEGERTVGLVSDRDLVSVSPFGTDVGPESERAVAAGPDEGAVAARDQGVEDPPVADDRFEDQSICEACGSFARDLATFNGQLLCGDCRDI